MGDHEPLVAREGGPARRLELHALIAQLPHGLAARDIDHPKRLMDQVAVLRMLQTKESAVGREARHVERRHVAAPDPDGLSVVMDRAGGFVPLHQIDVETLAVAHRRRSDPVAKRQPVVPRIRYAAEEGARLAAAEGLREPTTRLVARLLLEPEHELAVERRGAVAHTDGVIGHAPARACREVLGPDLPDAALVGGVDEPVRSDRRPGGHRDIGSAEALLPGLHDARG